MLFSHDIDPLPYYLNLTLFIIERFGLFFLIKYFNHTRGANSANKYFVTLCMPKILQTAFRVDVDAVAVKASIF